ncbi:MAG TPA: CBS domain-containing protein [Actinomycetota bacterium]
MTHLVRHVMATDLKTATPDMGPADAAGLMASHGIGAVPLVDERHRPVGVVTDRDLVVRVLAARTDPTGVRLEEIATRRSLSTISPDAPVSTARDQMAADKVKRLLVVKDEELVGIVSLGDLAQVAASGRAIGEAVTEIFDTGARERAGDTAPDPGTPERVRRARQEGEE